MNTAKCFKKVHYHIGITGGKDSGNDISNLPLFIQRQLVNIYVKKGVGGNTCNQNCTHNRGLEGSIWNWENSAQPYQ